MVGTTSVIDIQSRRDDRNGTEPIPLVRTVRLPGGAVVEESQPMAGSVTLRLWGEIDLYDKHALIDAVTASIMAGARDLHIDATGLTFADMATLRALDQARRFLRRVGGTVTVVGLRPPLARIWETLDSRTRRPRAA